VEIIKKYESWLAYWVSEPDRGQSHAINKGFQRATGQILSWLNSDDYFEIGAFRKVATQFTNKPDTVALCGSCLIIDAGGNPMYIKASRSLSPERLLRGGLVPGQPAVFFKHEVIKALGGLDEQFHQSLDREFWVRIGLHYPADKLAQIKDTLAVTRYWPGCKTALGSKSMVEEHKRILAKVFSRKDLPENLKKIRPHAYSEVFWREALMAKDAKAYASVFRALLKATWASPFYSLRRGFEHLMRLITKPMRVQEKVASNQDIPIV
jgi:glycosyltransferase involved in cell wall biosynthesis